VLPKRNANGDLPVEVADAASAGKAHGHVPEAARGPAIAGTDPHRGLTDTEGSDAADADKTSRDIEG
jgi:hypothetical protein